MTISPGTAFGLAYLPARRIAYAARVALIARNASTIDPDLAHAIDFGRHALEVEESLVANVDARLEKLASMAEVSMTPISTTTDLDSWLRDFAVTVAPHLTSELHQAAWLAGLAGRRAVVAAELAAQLAYLRCSAPANPDLATQAHERASELKVASAALTKQLDGTNHPYVRNRVDLVEQLVKQTSNLAPTNVEGYRELNELVVAIYQSLDANINQLDTPFETRKPDDSMDAHTTERLKLLGADRVKFNYGTWEITIDADALLENWDELRAAAPVTSLHVRGRKGRAGEIVRSPNLATLKTLDLDRQGITDDDVIALAANPHAAGLLQLTLRFNVLTERGIEALAASPILKRLEYVSLEPNPIDPVDQQEYYNETSFDWVRTEAGKKLEAKYGPLRWLRRP